MSYTICVAQKDHIQFASIICNMMQEAAKVRRTGIAKRQPDYIKQKIMEGKAIIALHENTVVGFCYIENWDGFRYVANSGLIVHPDHRHAGLARMIKQEIFVLSKSKYPNAQLFGITTSLAVMKINSELGYKPVTFSELTQDDTFWSGCKSCCNFDILTRTNRKMCLCTAMICDLSAQPTPVASPGHQKNKAWKNFIRFLMQRRNRIDLLLKKFPKLTNRFNNEKEKSCTGI